MPINQSGAINTTALIVADVYLNVVPPQTTNLNGVPTNVIGAVGTASWGPSNVPVIISDMASYAAAFGAVQNRTNDMGTAVATAVQQGANNFRCVRVTDGSDLFAAAQLGGTGALALTAKYTGSVGNLLSVSISTGSAAGTWRITVALPRQVVENFDNIAGTGNQFWLAAANAINAGSSILRGPSALVTAVAGASTSAPVAGTVAFSGGTDGAGVSTSNLLGSDALRTGVYALRNQGVSVGMVADLTDPTAWTTLAGLALSEGIYFFAGIAPSTTVAAAVALKASAGIDTYSLKLMHGDYLYWQDTTNAALRLVSPVGFAAGRMVNLSPQNSSLNKPIAAVAGSQKSGLAGNGQVASYSSAELQLLVQAGIDVICNPSPGGTYWACRAGHNSSSNAAVQGDNYTRMTNYIASTLNAGMGVFIGEPINPRLFDRISATQNSYLQAMLSQGMLALQPDGSLPYKVVCSAANNPQSRTSLGYVQADVQVTYMGITEKLIINLEGGTTVTIARQ